MKNTNQAQLLDDIQKEIQELKEELATGKSCPEYVYAASIACIHEKTAKLLKT